jgi:hypothetical protein
MNTIQRTLRMIFATFALAGVAGLAALAGCRGHTNYPAIPSARLANDNPNEKSPDEVIPEAMRWLIAKYDPAMKDRAFAINGPAGLRRAYYERIARNSGPLGEPLTPEIWESKSMPIFHIARVWVREREAKVDILRPRSDMTDAKGQTLYQGITVTLQGEPLRPWRAVYGRSWEDGIIQMPEPYFIPAVDNPEQYRLWRAEKLKGLEPDSALPTEPTPQPQQPSPSTEAPSNTPSPQADGNSTRIDVPIVPAEQPQ